MYKIGDKVKVISDNDHYAFNGHITKNFEAVIYNGFITTVNLVEDDVVWIEDMNGGSVWIETCNIELVK